MLIAKATPLKRGLLFLPNHKAEFLPKQTNRSETGFYRELRISQSCFTQQAKKAGRSGGGSSGLVG
jgi:hypothetical protein